ncbi:MAG: glycosyltransferase family 4 protein, partial [Acidobacteriota bacterium]
DMLELMTRKTAGLDVPISVVPNWAELETVFPAPRSHNNLLEELEIADKFVILYAGNMGPPNEMEAIIQAADILRDRDEIHWVFLGTGAKRPWLMNEIRVRNLKTVTVLDPRPRSEQSVFLNACDIALVSLVNGMLGVSMPSRTYNILAAGKPILAIAEAGSEIALIVEEENVGWVVPPAAPKELAEAVVKAQARAIELPDMGRRARNAAESKYSVELAIEGYRSILVD